MEGSPAEVLARINRLVMSGEELGMATVLYLLLDRDLGEVVFASAGHPPPLVLSPEGARFLEGGRSVPVGATEAAVFREAREALSPGSTLLLYTDGLVERRDTPLETSLAELAASAEAGAGPIEDLCDQVLSAVLGRREPPDDVALLAVRLAPSRASRLVLALPARPDTLASLRRRLGRFLRGSGASEDEVYEISLSISEAAANAIEHAYGPEEATFQVEAELLDGAVVASVRDFGRWRKRRGEGRGRGLRIIEGLMDEVELSTEGEGTVVRMRRVLPRSRAPVSAG
jgi:anti-sigma regulatory factor (Ser/Thr protein kinase)